MWEYLSLLNLYAWADVGIERGFGAAASPTPIMGLPAVTISFNPGKTKSDISQLLFLPHPLTPSPKMEKGKEGLKKPKPFIRRKNQQPTSQIFKSFRRNCGSFLFALAPITFTSEKVQEAQEVDKF